MGVVMNINIKTTIPFGTKLCDIEVPTILRQRIKTGIGYVDDALGGKGFTPTMVTLFTGTPGAGKTTMCMIIADSLGESDDTVVLFNTSEESLYQTKMVSERLRLRGNFYTGGMCLVPELLEAADKIRSSNPEKAFFLIVDSLQTLDDGKYNNGGRTNQTAIRAMEMITTWCKENATNAIIIGQVNKGGKMAGSNKLKHMIDAHMHLSVETRDHELAGCRVLEMLKNRFGGSGHTFFLRLNANGFKEIARISVD